MTATPFRAVTAQARQWLNARRRATAIPPLGATAVLVAALLAAGPAAAHDGVEHATPEEAARHRAATAPALAGPLPDDLPGALPFDLGGPFALIDHTGAGRSEADPEGRMQLLFFGYANCPSICAVAMPMMAEVTDALAARGVEAVPVMITVDPERDTPETMDAPLAEIHPAFVGLTGSAEALAAAYEAFGVERTLVGDLPDVGPIYAHGSHIYLLDAKGEVLTLLPPVLSTERMAAIALRYAPGEG